METHTHIDDPVAKPKELIVRDLANERIDQLIRRIYRRLYQEADPPGDFERMIASGEARRSDFFLRYYLSQDRQDEIVAEECTKARLPGYMVAKLKATIALGCSPVGHISHRKEAENDGH